MDITALVLLSKTPIFILNSERFGRPMLRQVKRRLLT